MYLNLDPDFNPFQQKSIVYELFIFNGGEPHIKVKQDLTDVSEVMITHRLRSFTDLGVLLVTVDALRRGGVQSISAFLPYFPGGRQDRVMVAGEPLTVKIYADIINGCELEEVVIYDPHSEVTSALLSRCKAITNHSFIEKVVEKCSSNLLLISPDGGALKKIYKVAAHLQNYEVVECSKSRDVRTGALTGFQVYRDDLEGTDCLIVDDICDGGGTFLGLATELKKKNAGRLCLAVSHGIFSKGTEKLTEIFDTVFCTDSFSTLSGKNNLKQVPLVKGEIF